MGVHSTLFGPVKYAILPQHLKPEELIGGNGLVEMGTFVAILLGTIAGGVRRRGAARRPGARRARSRSVSPSPATSSAGAIPVTPAVAPELAINWNPFTETARNLRFAQGNRVVWLSMLGISWFWFYGAIFLAQFAGFARDVLGGNEAGGDVPARAVLDRHRRRVAALRAAVGTPRRARPGAVRLDRPVAVRDRPLAREPRALRHSLAGLGRFAAQPGALARRGRPGADRALRRVLHRPALRADPGALGALAPVADHRRQQHPQRAVHGRVGRRWRSGCCRRGSPFRSSSWSPGS